VILVVVAVHSFLAYFSFAPSDPLKPFTSKPYAWVNYPVVDTQRWAGFDLVFLYNENLVLTLMFMMSGWFVWGSITRKGRWPYLRGRLARLGIPLVLAIAFVSPLAYYPAYALREANPNAADYLRQWMSLDFWSPGPAWFIAFLLVFDLLIVPIHKLLPRAVERLGRFCAAVGRAPQRFYLGFVGFVAAAYAGLCLAFGAQWLTHVPYEQTSRIFVFLMYFFAGVGHGDPRDGARMAHAAWHPGHALETLACAHRGHLRGLRVLPCCKSKPAPRRPPSRGSPRGIPRISSRAAPPASS
jgi:hypothetical protein